MNKNEDKITKLSFIYHIISILNYYSDIIDNDDNDDNKNSKKSTQLNEPIINLISNYEEIKKINSSKKENIYKFFYLNRKTIHKILYENEKIIEINIEMKKSLSFYFYLSLLIKDNINIIDYQYPNELIFEMNELQKNNETEIYKKIIYSKLILDFIKYYKGAYEYDKKKDEEKLKKIEEENNRIIEENKNFCEEMGFDQEMISKKNIEEIYIEIIINFIKSNKFENYQEVDNILNELDFKNIFITNKMFKKLSTILNSKEDYIKCYIINDPKDLYNDKIINFYYILLNYIFKNSIYINNIPLLLKLKGKILKFIKNESIHI